MLATKEYNFEILFEKLQEAKVSENTALFYSDPLIQQVDKDIESLRSYIDAINEPQYQTYSRS